ncbi:hypothetical protein TanjilG_19717 [Lupinus angustifolius]|uniref:Uncharacterized protein n=1 Tax=Lupinus angustifolius TaxID=3871 RepID=A0A4P1RAJ6_LUPAN|nr:hypothetical protein TanjilG_19717 [Lupinus angustifolius]
MSTSTSNVQSKKQHQRMNPFQKRQFTTIIGNQAKGAMSEQICKKKKITKKCPSMSLDNFLNNNQEYEDQDEGGDEHEGEDVQEEDVQEEGVQEGEDREENDEIYEVGEDINHQNEQVDESNNSTEQDIPESHFKELIRYWSLGNIQEMSEQNSKNKAQAEMETSNGTCELRCHKGKIGMRATKENKEMPNQAEMFCETRQSKKGEPLDQETTNAMAQLKDLIENSSQQPDEAFQSVFGKEKPGRVQCH